jgi:hypothetical protein
MKHQQVTVLHLYLDQRIQQLVVVEEVMVVLHNQ